VNEFEFVDWGQTIFSVICLGALAGIVFVGIYVAKHGSDEDE
jgi:hypothetical protein